VIRRDHQHGAILVLAALSLIVLCGAVGLAIDAGRAYGVKARLNAAVDAAAIATARALAEGNSEGERLTHAREAGLRFFRLNYPAGFLGATASEPAIDTRKLEDGRWVVDISASADMPTTFMRVLGRNAFEVSAAGQATRRDLDVMLVMDSSGSLGSAMSPLKQAAINNFISRFVAGPGGDRVGLVSFAAGAVVDVPIDKTATRGFDRAAMTTAINRLSAVGTTATAEGLARALAELDAIPSGLRSGLRVILLFSDGAPNVINGRFLRADGSIVPPDGPGNLHSEAGSSSMLAGGRLLCAASDGACQVVPADRRNGAAIWYSSGDHPSVERPQITYLPLIGSGDVPLASHNGQRALTTAAGTPDHPYENTRCNVNRAARNMVENIAHRARNEDIRIYTIGLGSQLNGLEIGFCGYTLAAEQGSALLRRVANTADSDSLDASQPRGLYCFAAEPQELDRCFSAIASEVLRLSL